MIDKEQRIHEFMRLFTSHEVRLRSFAMSLIPNWADAEDVMQQANLLLWKKFDQFTIGSDFFAWASRIVYLEAMGFKGRQLRSKIQFGAELFDEVAAEAGELSQEFVERERVLGDCVGLLRENSRELLRMRYEDGGSIPNISKALGRSQEAIYNSLSRIRKTLIDCVNRKLRLEGAL